MPVVGVFINDAIGLNGVPSYEKKQCTCTINSVELLY